MPLQGMVPKRVKVILLHLGVCLVCSPTVVRDAIYGRHDARPNMAVFAMYEDGLIGGVIYNL